MPKPVYILASRSAIEDKRSNMVSIFNVLEKINCRKYAGGAPQVIVPNQIIGFSVISVWMLEPSDPPDGELEAELIFVHPPNGRQEIVASGAKFQYEKGNIFVRVNFEIGGMPAADGSGMLIIRNRVRRPGTDEWIAQEFPILMEFVNDAIPIETSDDAR